eukprot:TRINITY_DN3931_c0_g1_i2.p1 TRINITY_DN3931_c0_g1~~TRINITY_DN3931_c0_g1_i2.p1  ORF type:complete len:210 (+),score=36.71 TRINITY_DN3931_c0_g1_i2:926-1555(+)
MQAIYIYTMLGYLIARSYKQQTPVGQKYRLPESEQKAALSLLSFAIAKLLFSLTFTKVITTLPNFVYFYIVGAVCAIALFIHTLVSSLSASKYTPAWLFASFFWGIQDAAIAGKLETEVTNPISEDEETLDADVIGRGIGIVVVGFVGAFVRDEKPFGIMIALIAVFFLSFGFSFLNMKGEKGEDRLLLEGSESIKDIEPKQSKQVSHK